MGAADDSSKRSSARLRLWGVSLTLRRLITFKDEALIVLALYRTHDGPDPNTKARTREVRSSPGLALRAALDPLESDTDVKVVWTRIPTTREDMF